MCHTCVAAGTALGHVDRAVRGDRPTGTVEPAHTDRMEALRGALGELRIDANPSP